MYRGVAEVHVQRVQDGPAPPGGMYNSATGMDQACLVHTLRYSRCTSLVVAGPTLAYSVWVGLSINYKGSSATPSGGTQYSGTAGLVLSRTSPSVPTAVLGPWSSWPHVAMETVGLV